MEGKDSPKEYSYVEHVTDEETDDLLKIREQWFEGKSDIERLERIMDSATVLRRWAVDKGAKKEPALPPNVHKISDEFSLDSEGIYYRYSEDAPDPNMIWGIDLEDDPAAFEASNGIVLRVIKDSETSITIIDFSYMPEENKSNNLRIGLSVIKRNDESDTVETINFPSRRISRLSGPELKYIDIALRSTQESLTNPARQPDTNISPKFRGV